MKALDKYTQVKASSAMFFSPFFQFSHVDAAVFIYLQFTIWHSYNSNPLMCFAMLIKC